MRIEQHRQRGDPRPARREGIIKHRGPAVETLGDHLIGALLPGSLFSGRGVQRGRENTRPAIIQRRPSAVTPRDVCPRIGITKTQNRFHTVSMRQDAPHRNPPAAVVGRRAPGRQENTHPSELMS